jgi:transposase
VSEKTSVLVSIGMSTDVSFTDSNPSSHQVTLPLPNDAATLQAMILELLEALKNERQEREAVQQRLDQLLRRLYGPKAERFDPNQPWLIPELAAAAEPAAPPAPEPASKQTNDSQPPRQGHGRKALPKDLPRRRREHTLSEAQRLCPGCGQVCQKFGEEISEQLDYIPAKPFVWEHVRFKYACPKCHDYVTTAAVPAAVIAKGVPGPGLLAQIVASKYADHLPLHRLERIFARHHIDLKRSTMCAWMAQVAARLRPAVDLMADLVRQSKMIHTDATKMPYLDESAPKRTLSGQLWLYYGDRAHPFNVFDFCRDHSASGIDAFLKAKSFHGYLNADALNVYDHLFRSGDMIEVGCWAHCRRKFYEAKESDPSRSHLALSRIRLLYQVEEEAKKIIAARELTGCEADEVRRQLRQEKAIRILNEFQDGLLEEEPKVLPKSPMGQASAYALRHWQALTRYLGDGFLDIDNNLAEMTLRHIAIGRKNWLFAGSQTGGETAALLFSVTSTCHRHHVDAFAYLHDLLQRLAHDPQPSAELLRHWLPDRWKASKAEPADSG